MHACAITTTANRSVLGSMNDHTFAAKLLLSEPHHLSLTELHFNLAEVPLKAIGYRYPREVALDLLTAANPTP